MTFPGLVGYIDSFGSPYCISCAYKHIGKVSCRICPQCGRSLALTRTRLHCVWHRCGGEEGVPFEIDWRDQEEPFSNPEEIAPLEDYKAEGIVCVSCREPLVK